jgi:L-threonylcarbamoyladenylate synthase
MEECQYLLEGKVGVLPTDTLYGLVASATNEAAVRRVYKLKNRALSKPCIVLISALGDLKQFGIELTEDRKEILKQYWPGPTSIALSCGPDVSEYLHGGTGSLAFRLPKDDRLTAVLRESGPLIAPSANPEGMAPATSIEEARAYFRDSVDFYKDGGELVGEPSTLISLDEHDQVAVLRKGR